jgi:hypothetical protein
MITISHYRIEDGRLDGWREKYGASPVEHGLYCCVTTDEKRKFRGWMRKHCPTTKFEPFAAQYWIHIHDEKEIMLFSLRWL